MRSSLKTSTSIIAAGSAAIVGSAVVGGLGIFMLLTNSTMSFAEIEPDQGAYARWVADVMGVCFLGGAVFVLASGIGIIRLRRWARSSLMVIAGLLLLFAFFGAATTVLEISMVSMPGPPETKTLLLGVLALIFGVPVAVAVWWLTLFTRRSVAAQFEARLAALPAQRNFRFSKPGCPLPISIVAWFLLSTLLNLLFLPFLPVGLFAYFAGHIFSGASAAVFLIGKSLFVAAAGIGLLRLKRWSFPLGVVLQLFYIVRDLIGVFEPSNLEKLNEVLAEMHVPPFLGNSDLTHYAQYAGFLGLSIPLACLACLLYARKSFYTAAHSFVGPESLREEKQRD